MANAGNQGMTKYYIPECEPDVTPVIGQQFPTLELGIQFYRSYAARSGFDVRLGSNKRSKDRTIMWKYVYCNKEGKKNPPVRKNTNKTQSGKTPKRRVSTRLGCEALIAFKYSAGKGYVTKYFEDRHCHPLCSEQYRQFMKSNRNLDAGHKKFVMDCARVNIGPMKSHRLYKEVVGGYCNVGCTSVEFKNFKRDLKAYAEGVDAQMLLDNWFRKRETSGFYFDYDVDDMDQLTRLFWSDPISRRNYAAFGDVVSFDATYETNRYKMIFAPFTGIDNHGKIVTFGAGLLSDETVESYTWLFEKFKDCMRRCPTMIITDQDKSMEQAVPGVFQGTRHRLCMWHITKKISDKVPARLKHDNLFKKKIDDIIWSEIIEPEEFENRWFDTIEEFDLRDHTWFCQIYGDRKKWIPAYFRDFPFSGLLKTTSCSESVNSFFCRYLNPSLNLVEFVMRYDSAIDSQRHAQDKLNSEATSSIPDLKTPLLVEKHALEIYSTKVFLDVQNELLDACFKCRVLDIDSDDILCTYKIKDDHNRIFDVVHNRQSSTYNCSCKKFIRLGVLCCHVFVMFRDMKVNHIPETYIVDRWTKGAYLKVPLDMDGDTSKLTSSYGDHSLLMNRLYSEFYSCVGMFDGDSDKISTLTNILRDYKESTLNLECSSPTFNAKHKLFENYYQSSVPDVVSVLPPVPVKTKGSGRRLKSNKEQAIESSKKPLRLCRNCNQKSNHDTRNCPEGPKSKS